MDQIKNEIKKSIDENDTEEINPTILWDTLKAVIKGKLIAITSKQKKLKQAKYLNLVERLKHIEVQHQTTCTAQLQQEIKDIKGEIDNILGSKLEKKLRFLKQDYYEAGPRPQGFWQGELGNNKVINTTYKIRDSSTHHLRHNEVEMENTFRDYYEKLYSQPPSSDKDAKRQFLSSLDLPSIGEKQNMLLQHLELLKK